MIKKTVTYTDYNGNERTEDFYFNLSKAEVMKLELGVKGGLAQMINRLISEQDQPAIVKVFEDLVAKAYGVKSPDGKLFIKNKEVLDEFVFTEAYSNIYWELATDAKKAAEFVNGIIPANMAKEIEALAPAN